MRSVAILHEGSQRNNYIVLYFSFFSSSVLRVLYARWAMKQPYQSGRIRAKGTLRSLMVVPEKWAAIALKERVCLGHSIRLQN
jgi:hypothetical protein